MKIWFTSDTHFGHANIIEYCNRPFKDVHRMNTVLINNWNQRIKEDDIVIFLGDFGFRGLSKIKTYLDELHGHITFIQGNHDNNNSLNAKIFSLVIEVAEEDIFCTHRPQDYSSAYSINLVGHIHGLWKINRVFNTYLVNVGVDVWRYYPVDIDEILALIAKEKRDRKKKGE